MTQAMFNNTDRVSQAPIFVGGLMKSGTSLMRKLISQSTSIFGGLETHWFGSAFREADSVKKLSIFFDLPEAQLSEISRGATSNEDFLTVLMAFCTARDGKNRWIEKTPGNIMHGARIWAYWPDATLIRVKRDPLDVFTSWKKNKGAQVDGFIRDALTERRAAAEISAKGRYLEVEYETLIARPQDTINDVFTCLNETIIPDVTSFGGDATDARLIALATGKTSATAESLKRPIFSSSVGAWRDSLTSEEVDKISQALR